MKFGLFILSAIAYLGSCDVSDSLGYANLKTREMLSSKINGNVEGILARTFGEAQPKAQGFVSLPVALAVETNSNYFQDDGGIIGKKYITPIQQTVLISPQLPPQLTPQLPPINVQSSIQTSFVQPSPPNILPVPQPFLRVQPQVLVASPPPQPDVLNIVPFEEISNSQPIILISQQPSRQIQASPIIIDTPPSSDNFDSDFDDQDQQDLPSTSPPPPPMPIYLTANLNLIRGVSNQIKGQQNILDGSNNKIGGHLNTAQGNNNYINGFGNDVYASSALVKGHQNLIIEDLGGVELF